jgi:hypothetical protein
MRLPLLVIPLIALAGCTGEAARSSAPSTPSTPATPSTTAPSAPAKPAATAPSTPATPATPSPAAVAPTPAPAPKPVAAPVTVDLHAFSGPTDNAELFGYDDNNSRLFLYSSGTMTLPAKLAADGDYEIVVTGACDEAKGEFAKFTVAIDGQVIGGEVSCTGTDAKEYVIKAPGLKAGEHKLAVSFLNDVYKENEYDLNFYVHGVILRPAK